MSESDRHATDSNQDSDGPEFVDTVKDYVNAYVRGGLVPKDVDRELYETIRDSTGNGKLLNVRPYPDNRGIEAGEELLMALHNLKLGWLGAKNVSSSDTFEMWFNDGQIEFMFYVDDKEHEQKLRTQIRAFYPNAKIEEKTNQFPELRKRDYVAGCELELKQSKFIPIRSNDRQSVYEFDSDPYTSITSDLVGPSRCRTMIQVVFRPAHHKWTEAGPFKSHLPGVTTVEEVSESLKREKYLSGFFNTQKRKPTKNEQQLSNYVIEQRGRPAYHVNIRIISFSPYKAEAKSKVWSVAKSFEQSYLGGGDQTLVQRPKNGKKLVGMMKMMAKRDWVDRDMIMMVPEVAGLAHLPSDDINAPEVNWFPLESGDGVPAAAPQFERSGEGPGESFSDDDPDSRTTRSSDAFVNLPNVDFKNSAIYTLISSGINSIRSINKPNYINDPDVDGMKAPQQNASSSPDDEDDGVEFDPSDDMPVDGPEPDTEIVPDEEVDREEFVAEENADLGDSSNSESDKTGEDWGMEGVDPIDPEPEEDYIDEDTYPFVGSEAPPGESPENSVNEIGGEAESDTESSLETDSESHEGVSKNEPAESEGSEESSGEAESEPGPESKGDASNSDSDSEVEGENGENDGGVESDEDTRSEDGPSDPEEFF